MKRFVKFFVRFSRLWLIAAFFILLTGCKTIKETVEVPVYVHDTLQTVKAVHDSTYIDRWHTIYMKGDTLYIKDSVDRWHSIYVHDTVRESVEVPVEVIREVEREVRLPLRWWQKTLLAIGICTMLLFVGRIAISIYNRVH